MAARYNAAAARTRGNGGGSMSLSGLGLFCVVYFLAVATPGPGIAAVIARALAHGTRGAGAFIAGYLVGDLLWFTIAVAGLAALAHSAQALFVAVKYVGAAYLLYLAYRAWNTPVAPLATHARTPEQAPLQLFLGSLSLTLANPKTIAFFLALLPTVVRLDSLTITGYGAIALVICIVLPLTLACYVWLATHARKLFQSARSIRALNRGAGIAIAGAAVVIATR
jgi:threonine/homoserine/homoserine lactone efflux protein